MPETKSRRRCVGCGKYLPSLERHAAEDRVGYHENERHSSCWDCRPDCYGTCYA